MTTLHLISGLPCSGKTTYAKQLESEHNALHLSGDEWISIIIKNKNDIEELDRLRDPVEQILWNLSKQLLGRNIDIILDNGFWSKEERIEYLSAAKSINKSVLVTMHYMNTDYNTLLERIDKRNTALPHDCFHVSKTDLDEWIQLFEAPQDTELKLYDHFEIIKL